MGDRGIDVPFPVEKRKLSLFHNIRPDCGFHSVFFEIGIGLAFTEVNAAEA
jgi:hypothetical protein